MNTIELHKRKRVLNIDLLTDLISWICALLFLYAAFYKLIDYSLFKRSLELSPLISYFAGLLSVGLPVLEVLIALMLFNMHFRKWGLYGFILLMLAFSVYIFYILNFSSSIPCSCGGVLQRMGWTEHLVFNLVFIAAGVLVLGLLRMQNKTRAS